MYNEIYYKKHEEGSYQSAVEILKYIKSFINFDSVIDFGCGMGTWCKAMENLEITNYLGIDQHIYDSDYMLIPERKYLQYDLQTPLTLSERADFAISVEVAEHMEEKYANTFVKNLCSHSDIILFSAAIPYQGGTGHINEQPCTYWVNLFGKYGFKAIDCIRPFFWENDLVEIWYRNNCILFVKNKLYPILSANIPSNIYPLDVVHPIMLKRILKKGGLIDG